jgi:hypothetical protein
MIIITVGDLVTELQQLPQDANIFDLYGERFENLKYSNEIYLGDPANPRVEITEGYILE